ncbi:hypothetical protein KO488_13810 [Poseidonibacter lekithochrous]|uniref:hypothetical protein n=1 Tax=Poseidonibacter TaxID=2321187 RepID=UPI001C08C672|nr:MULTISPECIES: hypothetical protein [Poseidonibacter]MBU3015838.1 hypothetical protein [Poseidonibacter lekithochrous]MDO6829137.1 hypothetical protein [Poseidonibacter sp. 1_MG-2023]
MKIKDLIEKIGNKDNGGVPNWMMGYFKRRTISFFNGQSDNTTDVCWIQSKNFTIDLRLPKNPVKNKDVNKYSIRDLDEVANYEGWVADSIYDGEKLSWSGGVSYLNHNKWPEPAFLKKVGNCMLEFSPSDVYVEDWRLQNHKKGPLIGLELVEETNLTTNMVTRKGGGLIISAEFAAICLGREPKVDESFQNQEKSLEEILLDENTIIKEKEEILKFETSVAKGDLESGYTIYLSTSPNRNDKELFLLDGYEYDEKNNQIIQTFTDHHQMYKRVYTIDFIDLEFDFATQTNTTDEAKAWFEQEKRTLNRHLEILK